MSSIKSISTKDEFSASKSAHSKLALFFWAEWQEQSKEGGQMNLIFQELSKINQTIAFFTVEAEEAFEISQQLEVSMVPTFVFIQVNNQNE